MDAFTALGSRAGKGRAAYQILCAVASKKGPLPSLMQLGEQIGCAESTTGKLLAAMEDIGVISRIRLDDGSRVTEIAATGERTGASKPACMAGNEIGRAAIVSQVVGWPKLTMTKEEFSDALATRGRFEDSAQAIRDRGSLGMPARHVVVSFGGVSDVYGSMGMRHGAGCQL